ncbi:FAD-binding oxidoreductase [Candidatus Binatia bacterium]|nr:FAD-binding oxidoreductase [Candidatus Binatia bacterium]
MNPAVIPHDDLTDIVGRDRVFDDPNLLRRLARDESFATPTTPRCVVQPATPEQVQELVRWANRTATPLVPVSSGAPHFRGDTVPGEGGAVIVDLSTMNAVLRVDRRNRVAMIEPGVTYGELLPALRREGLAPYMPLLPRRTKSVVGSMLEREPITMGRHQWDIQDPLLCIEVIFGNGELFRTGSAAGPGTIEEQRQAGGAQMRGMGPGQTDLQRIVQGAQGTMGIVTWATMKCRLLPTVTEAFLVASESPEPLLALGHELFRIMLGDDVFVLNAHNLAAILTDDAESLRRLRAALPAWILYFAVDGTGVLPEERIAYQVEQWQDLAQRLGLRPVKNLPAGVRADHVARSLTAPSTDPYWKLRLSGGCEDVFFLTTLDRAAAMVRLFHERAERAGYPTRDLGTYVQPTVQGTSCHCELNLPYDPGDGAAAGAVRTLVEEASVALANAGAFFSRPYGRCADFAYRRDAVSTMALKKLKAIFDPQHVMNPGKLCF